MVDPVTMAVIGGGLMAAGGLGSKKGRRPGISPVEMQSIERKSAAEGTLSAMFQERAKDPFQYLMSPEEQDKFEERRLDIYGEGRQRQQQQLMGAMSRTGALASGATNYNLMRFGQETLRDQQQFYFQDRQKRLQEREQAVQSTFGMGQAIVGGPTVGGQVTDVMNQRAREHNQWRNRWANMATSVGGQLAGYGLGNMAGGGGTGGPSSFGGGGGQNNYGFQR